MMNPDQSLALLVCYFGKWPWYLDYFIHSCSYNPTVDFFIITDNAGYHKTLPQNVKLIHRTLEDINQLASRKLGFQTSINYGYKLCDFKPAYGFIFSDLLQNYDWWGHVDLDVIFGDIRGFMDDDLLGRYHLISVRPDWLPGCFVLFKNEIRINTLFMSSKDYQKVFSSPRHFCFDETNFAHDDFTDGKLYSEIATEVESMTHVIKKLEAAHQIKPYFDLHIVEGIPGRLKWENGKLTYRNKYEVLLYHLIRLKKNYSPKTAHINVPDRFAISPTRIYH